jgi:hypothetical protein
MEVADTEAAVTLVEATSGGAGPMCTLAGPMCTLAGPMCTLAGPMIASPETTGSGIMPTVGGAVGVAGIGVMADSVMADSTPPATRTGGFIRPAIGRNELKPSNELKPMDVLNVHWRRTKVRACSLLSLAR